jgi:hypothetical protein
MPSLFPEMTTTTKWTSWATVLFSIGYAILLVQPQPQLNLTEIHTAAAKYMGVVHPSSTSTSTSTITSTPLKGLTVAITGATSGIGFELTRKLTAMGAHVVAIGRSPSKLQALAASSEMMDQVTTIVADLTDLESVARAADEISNDATIPTLDILVNNAGMHLGSAFHWPGHHPSTAQGYDLVFGGTSIMIIYIHILVYIIWLESKSTILLFVSHHHHL